MCSIPSANTGNSLGKRLETMSTAAVNALERRLDTLAMDVRQKANSKDVVSRGQFAALQENVHNVSHEMQLRELSVTVKSIEERLQAHVTAVVKHAGDGCDAVTAERLQELSAAMLQKADRDEMVSARHLQDLETIVRQKMDVAAAKLTVLNKIHLGARVHSASSSDHNGGGILSGGAHIFTGKSGFAFAPEDKHIMIMWDEAVSLTHVGFRLWDQDDRFYTYTFEFQTTDGIWHVVCNRRLGQSWQWFPLLGSWSSVGERIVKGLRWSGSNTRNKQIHIVQLEAI